MFPQRKTLNLLTVMTSPTEQDEQSNTSLKRMEFREDGTVRHAVGDEEEYATTVTGEIFEKGDLVWVLRKGTSQYIMGSAREG